MFHSVFFLSCVVVLCQARNPVYPVIRLCTFVDYIFSIHHKIPSKPFVTGLMTGRVTRLYKLQIKSQMNIRQRATQSDYTSRCSSTLSGPVFFLRENHTVRVREREMVGPARPLFVLFGSSIVQLSNSHGGWGAILSDLYARKVNTMFVIWFIMNSCSQILLVTLKL